MLIYDNLNKTLVNFIISKNKTNRPSNEPRFKKIYTFTGISWSCDTRRAFLVCEVNQWVISFDDLSAIYLAEDNGYLLKKPVKIEMQVRIMTSK